MTVGQWLRAHRRCIALGRAWHRLCLLRGRDGALVKHLRRLGADELSARTRKLEAGLAIVADLNDAIGVGGALCLDEEEGGPAWQSGKESGPSPKAPWTNVYVGCAASSQESSRGLEQHRQARQAAVVSLIHKLRHSPRPQCKNAAFGPNASRASAAVSRMPLSISARKCVLNSSSVIPR